MRRFVYFYRMTHDTGFAPCVYENGYKVSDTLTLACCKGGQIRKCGKAKTKKGINTGLRHTIGVRHWDGIKNKTDEVYVVGIMKNRVLYIAQITDICEMKEYFSDEKNKNRLDSIYNYSETPEFCFDKEFHLVRNNNNESFHTDKEQEQCRRDELGKYVLISKSFVYFGNKAETNTIDKKYFDILPKRQETKAYSDGQNGFGAALDLIDEFWKDRITVASKNPTQKNTQNCKNSTQKTVRKDC